MAAITAGRFIASGARWLDLATGDSVRLNITTASTAALELEWADRCTALATLRHPLINTLLDFGALDPSRRFEAYAAGAPVPMAGLAAQRLLTHAVRFLQAHAIALPRPVADLALRPVTAGTTLRGRPFGLVLQRRPVLEAISDALDAAGPGGTCAIEVAGGPGSGLRTLQILVARAARIRGYVPIAASVIHACPWVGDLLIDRHVCVLNEGDLDEKVKRSLVRFLAHLGGASARRHVLITFGRVPNGIRTTMPLGRLGVTAMTSMIFGDPDYGPSPPELFDAARGADGFPGLFLSRLNAAGFDVHQPRVFLVHEHAQAYLVDHPPSIPSQARPGHPEARGALSRALTRGNELARRGRHLAASRLLSRAVRVLTARGDHSDAAKCARLLASIDLDRGRVASAAELFERARQLAPDTPTALSAAIGLGLAWLDDGRLLEAEALLRTTGVSASAMQERVAEAEAIRALARCLFWQGRYDEAAAVLRPIVGDAADYQSARAIALTARIRLVEGAASDGLRLARQALERASEEGECRTLIAAHRVMAAALAACGDVTGARTHVDKALDAARMAHLPLAALRVRTTWLESLTSSNAPAPATRRLATRMQNVLGRSAIPRLLRFQAGIAIERALGVAPDDFAAVFEATCGGRRPRRHQGGSEGTVAELEGLIELCHGAPDDRSALEALCVALCEKLRASTVLIVAAPDRRTLAQAGRSWSSEASVAFRVLASGIGIAPDSVHEPRESAEPIRYGGEIVAAIASRWLAGTDLDPTRAATVLKAGAVAAAASVRAVLDRAEPEPPGGLWTDLLGQSAPAVALREAVARAARAPFPVLIEGESGSGKELVARAIHRLSARRDRRFCAVNCAALTDDLLEAELFGHTRGAFTGAVGERAGLFEEADGGTMFLDEVGELSPRAQAKLLRVLQDGEVRRVGENFPRRIDVRVVAATNRRLEQETAAGRFRADLRFRLDVVRIDVPALRERPADIPLLATHFWNDASARVGSRATLSGDALAALSRYDWPGNVRELQNVIAWMAVHSPRRGRVGAAGLPASLATATTLSATTFDAAREEFERRFVRSALARANGHRARAAEAMGVTRQGLAKMMRRLGIDAS